MVKRNPMSDRENQDGKGKYVYCVIKSPAEKVSFGNIGFEDKEVYTLDYKGLSPVVSDIAFKEYVVNDEDVEVHRRVIERVMREHSVLPVAYGMSFNNKKLLLIAVSAGYKAMQKAFPAIDGKVELGIKVFLPKDIEGWNEAKRKEYRSDFLLSLNGLAADSKELKLFSDRLIFNAAFLIERGEVGRFSEQVSQISSKYGDVKVQYSGPWPAYNFVDIHILRKKRGGFR